MKSFNIHYFSTSPKPRFSRGFTAVISPNDNKTVRVQTSFCHRKDQFCKKTGAATAKKTEGILVKKHELPRYLGELAVRVDFGPYDEEAMGDDLPYYERSYHYVWRNML